MPVIGPVLHVTDISTVVILPEISGSAQKIIIWVHWIMGQLKTKPPKVKSQARTQLS